MLRRKLSRKNFRTACSSLDGSVVYCVRAFCCYLWNRGRLDMLHRLHSTLCFTDTGLVCKWRWARSNVSVTLHCCLRKDTSGSQHRSVWSCLPSANPLMGTGNYSATSNNMKLVHRPLMGGLLHLVQQGGDWGPRPLLTVPNVTAHSSLASVTITVLL